MKRYISSSTGDDIENFIISKFGRKNPGTGNIFVSTDGTFINLYPKLDTHEDLCEFVEDQLDIELEYVSEDYFIREYQWIRLRSDPRSALVELPKSAPTTSQWYALHDWLEYLEDKYTTETPLHVSVCDTSNFHCYAFLNNYHTDDIIKLMRRYYSSGTLYAASHLFT